MQLEAYNITYPGLNVGVSNENQPQTPKEYFEVLAKYSYLSDGMKTGALDNKVAFYNENKIIARVSIKHFLMMGGKR